MKLPLLSSIVSQFGGSPEIAVLIVAMILLLATWDGVWKLIAMWKSARNNQVGWYVCLAIFNTVGILPILYILVFQKPEAPAPATKP